MQTECLTRIRRRYVVIADVQMVEERSERGLSLLALRDSVTMEAG